jgi:CRP-like cAMP-binding protein
VSENHLLTALPVEERERLLPHLERVSLSLGDVLYETGEPIRHVYFPTSGVVSLLCTLDDGASIEVGTGGLEGLAGVPVFLGADASPNRALVQVAGEAMRMKSEVFRELAEQHGRLHDLLHLYTYALMTQMSLSVACNRFHSVEKRLARWLLMMHDRALVDEFQFTQELISRMIGTRRPHVSTAIGSLHNAGLIRNGRGNIHILDRQGLMNIACECYLTSKGTFDDLFNA